MNTELENLRLKISQERRWVDIKPYSHNIISLLLTEIDSKFGEAEAKRAIKELKLVRLGWKL